MHVTADAIICSVRPHGEVGAIVRALTASHGLMAGYVQGARGRTLRPVLIPGNVVKGEWRARNMGQLASLNVDPAHSRAHLLGEPLAVAAIEWACTLTATTLPEGQAYAALHSALDGLLQAIELAPAARGWAIALLRYEMLLLSHLGFGGRDVESGMEWRDVINALNNNRKLLVLHLLNERNYEILPARDRLIARLARSVAEF